MRVIFTILAFLCFANIEPANAQMEMGSTSAIGSNPPFGFSSVTNIFYQNGNWYLGYVPPYSTSNFLIFVGGVLAGDRIFVTPGSTLPNGVAIAGAYAYADNLINVAFVTTNYAGSTINTTPFTVTVIR